MSTYQAVSLASGRGVLPDRDIELTRNLHFDAEFAAAREYWVMNGERYLSDPVRWWQ